MTTIQQLTFDDDPPWMQDALCATIPNARDLFFLNWKGAGTVRSYKEARKICFRCPVRVDCLEWTLEIEAQASGRCEGMFGGRSPGERRKMIKERKLPPNDVASKQVGEQ